MFEAYPSLQLEQDILRTLPEHHAPQVAQLLATLDDGQEVVARQLAKLAGKHCRAIREQQLSLAEAAGVPQHLARRRVAGVILEANAQRELAQRYPAGLAAPARVDQLLTVGQQLAKGAAG